MHVLVTGAAGMIGRKLVERLVAQGSLANNPIEALTLVDVVAPTKPESYKGKVTLRACDLGDKGEAEQFLAGRPEMIFHLAGVPSGAAEADFDLGYKSNLDGTRFLLETIRQIGKKESYKPRIVYSSTIAVFGSPFPESIQDEFFTTPLTSYGTQKAIGELMLADYSRRGVLDGIALRLPTICIRPGRPNGAASGFFSNILREPLVGQEAVLPVPDNVRHWHASPRAAVEFLIHAAEIDLAPLGWRRALSMPGLSATVAEQIEALRKVAGEKAVKLIRREPDPTIMRIVDSWPQRFNARRAESLGFKAEKSFDEIIRAHIEDELGGRIAAN